MQLDGHLLYVDSFLNAHKCSDLSLSLHWLFLIQFYPKMVTTSCDLILYLQKPTGKHNVPIGIAWLRSQNLYKRDGIEISPENTKYLTKEGQKKMSLWYVQFENMH